MSSRALVLASLAAFVVGGWALSSEPAGFVVIDWTVGGADGAAERWVELSVVPVLRLRDATLRIETPPGIEVEVAPDPGAPFAREGRTPLGTLAAGAGRPVSARLRIAARAGGLVIVVIEGTDDGGRVIRESASIPVGEPPAVPRTRHGAAEFPAASDSPREP